MQRLQRFLLCCALTALSFGCISSTSGQRLDDSARRQGASFWVENHGSDTRQLDKVIAATLTRRGLAATSGARSERPTNFDFLVTYEDRWNWDLRMYLSEMRITVLDAKTNALLGMGRAAQNSLGAMDLSFEDVIERAVTVLVDGPSPEQTKR